MKKVSWTTVECKQRGCRAKQASRAEIVTAGVSPPSGPHQMVCMRADSRKRTVTGRRRRADARAATDSCVKLAAAKGRYVETRPPYGAAAMIRIEQKKKKKKKD